jgi:integrase/recombinase XerD
MRTRKPVNPGARLGMPFDAWPVADRAAWKEAFEPGRPRPQRRTGTRMRLPSKLALATCYARWLVWISTNHPTALAEGPGARASKDRVIDYLHALHLEITFRSLHGYACRLKRTLELMAPEYDWSWFTPFIKEIERQARAQPVKRPFVPADQLSAFGIELMELAGVSTSLPASRQAELFRNGLMIAFLASRPLRLTNMIELEIGTQFTETATGYDVSLPRTKTKNHRPLEFPMPAALVPFLRRYLEEFRPILAAGPYGVASGHLLSESFLWLARSGARFPPDTFADMISRLTMERFNVRLTPHDFRHCVATTIAEFNPEEYHIIRLILGHATTDTADANYIHAKGIEAARQAQAVVIRTRESLAAQNAATRNTHSCQL